MFRSMITRVSLAAIATLTVAVADARATLMARISTDGGLTFTNFTAVSPFTSVSGSVTTGSNVTVGVLGSSNQPINAPNANISQTNLSINNNTSGAVTLHIVVSVSDIGFLRPTGPSTLSSSLSGTYGPGIAASGNFQSFANLSNTQFANSGLTGGPQAFSAPLLVSGTANIIGEGTINSFALISSSPFSLTNTFDFNITLQAGAQFQVTGTTTLSNVPEPATLVGAGIAFGCLGFTRFRRRRGEGARS